MSHTHTDLTDGSLSHHSFIGRGAVGGVERNRTLHGAVVGDATCEQDTNFTMSNAAFHI